jgi:hypothetical protein
LREDQPYGPAVDCVYAFTAERNGFVADVEGNDWMLTVASVTLGRALILHQALRGLEQRLTGVEYG